MTVILPLDVVIDVVCPWCYVGKRRLDAAMAAVPNLSFQVRYLPFQLDPTIPPEGKDRTRYLLDKFRDPAAIAEMHGRLEAIGREVGIAFAFDRITVSPNTFDAHRLVRWATTAGKGDAIVERLFALYFEEGGDLSRAETLADAAAEIGLDRTEVLADLASDRDRAAIADELAFAQRVGITGVPCTIIARKYAISGAQPAEVLADAFRQIAAEAA
jgi:predicted DsbA family dithiol-disulfide isomerase